MEHLQPSQVEVFEKEYMPYINKWGKICCWLSLPLIFLPTLALMIFYGASVSIEGLVSGLISVLAANVVWYFVDPITLFPILHVPGMYLTYLGGNSKEIRAPVTIAALEASGVEQGTEQGTVIAAIAISLSLFISLAVMTIIAIVGNAILSVLPEVILTALNYLLPALFGALAMQRILLDMKSALIVLPIAVVLRYLNTIGVFKIFPLGGGYMQILLCAAAGTIVARMVYTKTKAKLESK